MKPWILKVFRARTSPEAIDLVSRLLEYTPSARITPLQVLFHIIATNSWRYWKFNVRRARTHSSTNCASRAPSCQAAGSSPFSSTSPNRWGEMDVWGWCRNSIFLEPSTDRTDFFRNWKFSLPSILNLSQLIFRFNHLFLLLMKSYVSLFVFGEL